MIQWILGILGVGQRASRSSTSDAAMSAVVREMRILSGAKPVDHRDKAQYGAAKDKAFIASDLFMQAAMVLGSGSIRAQGVRAGVLAYIGGVADSMAQVHHLTDWDTLCLWGRLVSVHLQIEPRSAAELVFSAARNQDAILDAYLEWTQVGGRAVRDWVSQRDPNAPLTLFEMVIEGKTGQW